MTKEVDSGKSSLLNKNVIVSLLLKEEPWVVSHGADPDAGFLGVGMLYYTMAYMLRAKLCVCIGSGGGFVPRLMRQAQRDLGMEYARTVLIDADEGKWGRPDWIDQGSFFRSNYSDIEIIIDRSLNVFNSSSTKEWKIDYLHIDGDHSHQGSLEDFQNFKKLMSPRGIITFHDTQPYHYHNITCWKAIRDIRDGGHRVIDFPWIGGGTAIIQLSDGNDQSTVLKTLHKHHIFYFFSMIRRRLRRKIQLLFQRKANR